MASVRFDATDAGRRVTLRRTLPDGDGRTGDVVGTLESWADGFLTVTRRTGERVIVAEDTVVAGKVVAPEVGSVALQERCAADWTPAEAVALNGWTLRYHHGVNHRSCSALALNPCVVPLREQLAQVRSWYARRSSPALIVTVEGSAVDSALSELPVVGRADVRVATTIEVLASVSPPRSPIDFRVADEPSPAFVARNSDSVEHQTHLASLLATSPAARFAVGWDSEGEVAAGRVSPLDRWAGLTHVDVESRARGRGIGSALVGVLADTAAQAGASHLWLQLEPDNEAAQRMYAALGFTRHHGYVFRDAS